MAGQVEVAAKGGAWAAFLNAGQVCTSAERFYVLERRSSTTSSAPSSTTRSRCASATRSTRETDIGPLVSARQREKVAAQVDAAVDAGATLLTGGGGPARHGPLLLARRRHRRAGRDRPAARGDLRPGRADRPGELLDEAIELANSTRFGLGGNVYTRDLETILRCMREIKAGTVWFNDPLTDNDAGPVRRHEAVRPRP